ncbi:Rieske (2Fe-2S) protein [Nocardioides dongkuii]|uniref:Rieske (2Fe-2S) protein n=1 Tax=Nocardioides dongkuii TaxID=2760089 RepID=UPI001878A0E2|nr:Rieske (2Fe-2S) protein [Nocardioides dongkuii]
MTRDDSTSTCACLSRRHALAGAATVGLGVPFLAACAGDDSGSASDPAGGSSSSGGGTPSGGGGGTGGGGGGAGLASTADIPVGGGVVFADASVVIVQPTEGDFRGWSAACTHQGCKVDGVEDGVIVCPCHNSTFSIEDGAPLGGPATSPLGEVALTVEGDSITLA